MIRLRPDDVEVYICRGLAKVELEQHDDAIMDYNQALRLKSDSALAYAYRGIAKVQYKAV